MTDDVSDAASKFITRHHSRFAPTEKFLSEVQLNVLKGTQTAAVALVCDSPYSLSRPEILSHLPPSVAVANVLHDWPIAPKSPAAPALEKLLSWLGPQKETDLDEMVSWHKTLSDSVHKLKPYIATADLLLPGDDCGSDNPSNQCCAVHRTASLIKDEAVVIEEAFGARPFRIGVYGEPVFPSGARYPYIWSRLRSPGSLAAIEQCIAELTAPAKDTLSPAKWIADVCQNASHESLTARVSRELEWWSPGYLMKDLEQFLQY